MYIPVLITCVTTFFVSLYYQSRITGLEETLKYKDLEIKFLKRTKEQWEDAWNESQAIIREFQTCVTKLAMERDLYRNRCEVFEKPNELTYVEPIQQDRA